MPPRFWTTWAVETKSQTDKEMGDWTAHDWREQARYPLVATEGFIRNTLTFINDMAEADPYDEELPYLQSWLEAALRNVKKVQDLIQSENMK